MRIDTKNKVLFIANPKTGSTSIRKMMDNKYSRYKVNNWFEQNNILHEHFSVYQWHERFNTYNIEHEDKQIKLDEYFIFMFIRNPWKKVVSAYLYGKFDVNGNAFYDPEYDINTANEYIFSDFLWVIIQKQTNYYVQKYIV
jgi:hypothetical protein